MIVVQVALVCAEDYAARREPHRSSHIERLAGLRAAGVVVGGGPAPDGRTADVFYRLSEEAELRPLVESDPYYRAGAWVSYAPRSFAQFVEPWELPPIVLDGSRRVTIVEGPTADLDTAQLGLVELRGAGRVAFGGFLGGGQTLAVVRSPDPAEAVGWLAETGLWAAPALRGRPLLHVL